MGLTLSGGLDPSKVRTLRVTQTIAAGMSSNVALNWDPAFPDGNYTVTAQVMSPNNRVRFLRFPSTPLAGSATARLVNDDAISSETVTVHALAIHD